MRVRRSYLPCVRGGSSKVRFIYPRVWCNTMKYSYKLAARNSMSLAHLISPDLYFLHLIARALSEVLRVHFCVRDKYESRVDTSILWIILYCFTHMHTASFPEISCRNERNAFKCSQRSKRNSSGRESLWGSCRCGSKSTRGNFVPGITSRHRTRVDEVC